MLSGIVKGSFNYFYSFWNFSELKKNRLEQALDTLFKSSSFKDDPTQSSDEWNNLYLVFEAFATQSKAGASIHTSFISDYLSKQYFCADYQNQFWINFGRTRQFPMGHAYWINNTKNEFIAYFFVEKAENKISESTVCEYFKYGLNEEKSRDLAYEFWVKALCAHWDEKVKKAFANYLKTYPGIVMNKKVIENTLSYALAWNNYHALETLLSTMLTIYQHAYSYLVGKSMQGVVANYDLSEEGGTSKKTILDVVIEHSNKYQNPQFLQTLQTVLNEVAVEVTPQRGLTPLRFTI